MSPVREARMIVCPALAIVATLATARDASAQLTVSVVDDSGAPITNGFRWQLEEDTSYGAVPGVPSPNAPFGKCPRRPELHARREHPPEPRADDLRRRHRARERRRHLPADSGHA